MIGIYKIQNLINNKVYVGSSKSLSRRQYQHFFQLKRGNHGNTYLQHSYNKYGKDSFVFFVLETCEEDKLLERESYWINFYDSSNHDKGYNLDSYESGRKETHLITKAKMKQSNRDKKKVKQFDLLGNLLNVFDSVKECSRTLNIERRVIQKILNKKKISCYGFVFRYIDDEFSFDAISIRKCNYKNVEALLQASRTIQPC